MSLPESTDQVLFLHNARCSKSRQVKALLEEREIEFTERRYLEKPLDADELQELERRLGRSIQEWTRTKEAAFGEAGLEGADEATWRQTVAETPILMERPIVVRGDHARVGRPPEDVLGLFEG